LEVGIESDMLPPGPNVATIASTSPMWYRARGRDVGKHDFDEVIDREDGHANVSAQIVRVRGHLPLTL